MAEKKDLGTVNTPGDTGFDLLLKSLAEGGGADAHSVLLICMRGLRRYFQSQLRGRGDPDEYVNETMLRAANALASGAKIGPDKVVGYLYGIAKNLLKGFYKEASVTVYDDSSSQHNTPNQIQYPDEQDIQLTCLQECLASAVKPDEAYLLQEYYIYGTGQVEDHRAQLADELGIPKGTLYVKIIRIKGRLEKCITRCVENSKNDESL